MGEVSAKAQQSSPIRQMGPQTTESKRSENKREDPKKL